MRGCELSKGSQLRGLGRTVIDAQTTWLMVESPFPEARYIRANAVTRTDKPQIASVTDRSNTATPPGESPRAVPLSARVEALWVQAQDAERRGQEGLAIDLYLRTAQAAESTQAALALQASQRTAYLREARRSPTAAPITSYPIAQLTSTTGVPNRVSPLPTHLAEPPIVNLAAPCGFGDPPTTTARTPLPTGIYASGAGRLRARDA